MSRRLFSCWSRGTPRWILLVILAAFPADVAAEAPRFGIRPGGDEQAFAGAIYKAVVVVEGCPLPEVIVESPAGAHYEDETLKYLPPGGPGSSR